MIVTGCQRSGTATSAAIFGLTHEEVLNPHNIEAFTLKELIPKLHQGEASWLAAPYVEQLKNYYPIIHLVRHPLAVINSLMGIGFWTETGHEPYRNFIMKHLPSMPKDPLEKSLYYWYHWNKQLAGHPRIRIEDFTNVPQRNSRPRANYTWDDLKSKALFNKVEELAREYYYE